MKKRTILALLTVLCTLPLCVACSNEKNDIKLPQDVNDGKKVIGSIIGDSLGDVTEVSRKDDCVVYSVKLKDRNDLPVKFEFSRLQSGAYFDGCKLYDKWVFDSHTDYVKQIVGNAKESEFSKLNSQYGITSISAKNGSKLSDNARVEVHTDKKFQEITADDIIAYINGCMDIYDFKPVMHTNWNMCRTYGVETLIFDFRYDSDLDTTGRPFEMTITTVQTSLSATELTCNGKKINEKWVKEQYDMVLAQYKRRRDIE